MTKTLICLLVATCLEMFWQTSLFVFCLDKSVRTGTVENRTNNMTTVAENKLQMYYNMSFMTLYKPNWRIKSYFVKVAVILTSFCFNVNNVALRLLRIFASFPHAVQLDPLHDNSSVCDRHALLFRAEYETSIGYGLNSKPKPKVVVT